MAELHLTKVAVGCTSADELRARMAARVADSGGAWMDTRYKPTRADALIGGSLFWIIKHRLVARQTILGFDTGETGRCIVRLDARVVPVRARPKRAHQGWRYLAGKDAPADFDGDDSELAAMPGRLAEELAALGLI